MLIIQTTTAKSSILGSKMPPLGSSQLSNAKFKVVTWSQIDSRKREAMPTIVGAVVSRGGQTVLDLGCGEGWLTRALTTQGLNVLGTDIIPALIERGQAIAGADGKPFGLGNFELASYAEIVAGKLATKFDVVVANFSLIGKESVEGLFRSMPSLINDGGAWIIPAIHWEKSKR
jgi:2-polyprenyl-3-methyl-5-hydroxy-6-metoxy-1,4-benzoquinol methylase